MPRTILVDTFDDEKFGALIAARAIPDSIFAVRLDTPGNRRGDFRDLMSEVRWELDRNGFEHVRIFASGGIDVEYILHLNPVCDAYGVGGAIADAPMIDYSLDIVEVAGEDRSKRGKRGGRKRLVQLEDGSRRTLPANAPIPEGARDLLVPLEEFGSPDVGSPSRASYRPALHRRLRSLTTPTYSSCRLPGRAVYLKLARKRSLILGM